MKRSLAFATVLLALLAFVPTASAFKVLSEPGEGAGQTKSPRGLAVNPETGRLYVADRGNKRIDVFDADGDFEKAFGWGVKNGSEEFQVCTTTCRKGLAGIGEGQFSQPVSIAVDDDPTSPSFQDVYVFDFGNERIQKFDESGNFILAFGSGEGEFAEFATFVNVGPGGTVYVVDTITDEGERKVRLQRFEPSGVVIAPPQILLPEDGFGIESMAVDSTGDFYVSSVDIRKYQPGTAAPIDEFDVPVGVTETSGAQSLTVDSADHIFVSTAAGGGTMSRISEFNAAGNPVHRFGYGSFGTFASALAPYHSASGDIYASEEFETGPNGGRVVHVDFPPPGPVIAPGACEANPLGNTKATLRALVNPEGKATTYRFQYVDEKSFEEEGGFSSPATETTPESASIGSDFVLHGASAEINVVPSTGYRCRVIATNADAPAGVTGKEGAFTSLPPLEIGSTWASEVEIDAATLNATVNPFGIPTTGFFEYVDEATYQKDVAELGPEHGFDHAAKAPAGEEIEFGGGESFKAGSAALAGLAPGTAYRYRIVASDPLIAPDPPPNEIAGPAKLLRTFNPPGTDALPDDRAWEMVSPPQKNSAEAGVRLGSTAGLFFEEHISRTQAAAGSGEAVTYTSWNSFGDPAAAQASSQYLSRRGAGGWATENITPFGTLSFALEGPYRGFSPDLATGAFIMSQPPLTAEAQPGVENLYLRDNQTGALQALVTEAPQFTPETEYFLNFCTTYAGASADGKRAFYAATGAMAGAPSGIGFSLYEWSAGEGLRLVSVLPDESPAAPNKGTHFGAEAGVCAMNQGVVAPALSTDGQVAFWTYGGKYAGAERPLMARIDGAETVQLDAKETGENAGKGPAGKGTFWDATPDGSKAFFTAPGRLTKDAGADGHLYRYDTGERKLTDLTPGSVAPEIQGVIGAGDDGTHLYFVARGALSGDAVKGDYNLYLWHDGEGLRFIGALAELDQGGWSSSPERRTARVSPDGRHLAFLSIEAEALVGYDNTLTGGNCDPDASDEVVRPLCSEALLYDADADSLTCASCNPSGARPVGPTTVPGWSNPYEGPRYLSDDGSRLYFESRDVLSSADQDAKRDVYQFERGGSGSCSTNSPNFSPVSGGCVSLISNGKSSDETLLIDASSDGRDVFFTTRSPLVGWDVNDNYDVYDAREGGGFPEPVEKPICAAEACKPPSSLPPPAGSSPGTASFQGPGNAKPKKVKKHKRKHRNAAQRRKGKRHGRAHTNGRAGR